MELLLYVCAGFGALSLPSLISLFYHYSTQIKLLNQRYIDLEKSMQRDRELELERKMFLREENNLLKNTNQKLVAMLSQQSDSIIGHFKDKNEHLESDLMEIVKELLSRDK